MLEYIIYALSQTALLIIVDKDRETPIKERVYVWMSLVAAPIMTILCLYVLYEDFVVRAKASVKFLYWVVVALFLLAMVLMVSCRPYPNQSKVIKPDSTKHATFR
jgi:hypothetical protein